MFVDSQVDMSFYEALFNNNNFLKALGRLMMSSTKLETNMKRYLNTNDKVKYSKKLVLGRLLGLLRQNNMIDKTSEYEIGFLINQRNYFTHNLHAYLSELPNDEYRLRQFISRAGGISDEMEIFSNRFLEAISKSNYECH